MTVSNAGTVMVGYKIGSMKMNPGSNTLNGSHSKFVDKIITKLGSSSHEHE